MQGDYFERQPLNHAEAAAWEMQAKRGNSAMGNPAMGNPGMGGQMMSNQMMGNNMMA